MNAERSPRNVIALNLGSTSLKVAGYSLRDSTGSERHAPLCIGRSLLDPTDAPSVLLSKVAIDLPEVSDTPDVIAHRIVHGADRRDPTDLTPATLAALAELSTLAPFHQAPALALVRAAIQRWPEARHVGVFDTSWHQTMPEVHRILPIDYSLYSRGVRRFGFHGLAFQSALRQLASIAPHRLNERIVLAHLGGGSSLCAVLGGASMNTTMGMTPLGGIPMASRSGSLDPGVLLHLQRNLGMSPAQIDQLLWQRSGLKGISGESADMRELLASSSTGARRAIEVYVSGIAQGIAAMAACIGGIDILVFSGGVGVHAAEIRALVSSRLEWLGAAVDPGLNGAGALEISAPLAAVQTFVVPVDEEEVMADAIRVDARRDPRGERGEAPD